jgi:GSH-dependent disulfide-bond oxidoreductase
MIELHTVGSPNGQRASIVLEESGLAYTAKLADPRQDANARTELLRVNPLGKLPVIVDRGARRPTTVYGSMAIALYVAQKCGRFLPEGLGECAELYHWLGIVCTDLSPGFGALFLLTEVVPERFAPAITVYEREVRRLLAALDARLASEHYIAAGRYTIVDMLAYPNLTSSIQRLPGGLEDYPHARAWAERIGARAAVQRGMHVSQRS